MALALEPKEVLECEVASQSRHLIHGLVLNPWNRDIFDFIGDFFYKSLGDKKSIEGKLSDNNGDSTIIGTLELKKRLEFNQTYSGRELISYKFRYDNERGFYLGEFELNDARFIKGNSICRIGSYLDEKDASFALSGFNPLTNEERKDITLKYLLDEGFIDEEKYDTSGEIRINPNGKEHMSNETIDFIKRIFAYD